VFHVHKAAETEAAEFGEFLKTETALFPHSADVNPEKK